MNYNEVITSNGNQSNRISFNELIDTVPESISGKARYDNKKWEIKDMPVVVTRRETTEMSCHEDHFDGDYGNDIPGGCDVSGGTICTPATTNTTDERVMLGSGHVFDNFSYVNQPAGTNEDDGLVSMTSTTGYSDCGYLEVSSGENWQYNLSDDNGGYRGTIIGGHSWTTIKQMETDSDNMKKDGNSTGTSSGEVYETEKDTNGYRRFWFRGDALSADSGGPAYTTAYSSLLGLEVTISGIFNWGWGSNCPTTHAGAMYIGDAETVLGVTV